MIKFSNPTDKPLYIGIGNKVTWLDDDGLRTDFVLNSTELQLELLVSKPGADIREFKWIPRSLITHVNGDDITTL